MKKKLYLMVAGLFLLTMQLKAQAPGSINYQGVARNSTGAVIANQLLGLEFTIYQGAANGSIIYQETDTATTNQFGLFTVAIGTGTVVGSYSFSNIGWGANSEYLNVAMDATGGANYSNIGTQQLLSVPYALYAAKSGGSKWTTVGNNIYNSNSGVVGIGTTTPAINAELDLQSSHTYGANFTSDSASGNSAVVNATYGGTGNYNASAVKGTSTPADGYGYGGFFQGGYEGSENIAIGATANNSYYGSFSGSLSSVASTNYGAFGFAESTGGTNYGVAGQGLDAGSGTSYGVYGTATSATGLAYGLYGVGSPVGGYTFASGTGVEYPEIGSLFGALTIVSGLIGEVNSSSGTNTTYFNNGVFGIATNSDASVNDGVLGYATGATTWNVGVTGISDGTGSDEYSIGVYGQCNANDGDTALYSNDAGYFLGDVDILGKLTATVKDFKIDDPLDPANKYLYATCVESPDMMNIYNGNATTDATGTAVVALPQYFQAENTDFKYQLTVIGQFAQAIVATKVNNNQFTIKTDKPNVEVSWQVTGVRNDPYANAHRTVAEVAKKSIEKGYYLFPQGYGQPQTMSIGYLISSLNKTNSAATAARIAHNPAAPPQRPTPAGNANNTDTNVVH